MDTIISDYTKLWVITHMDNNRNHARVKVVNSCEGTRITNVGTIAGSKTLRGSLYVQTQKNGCIG
jgi:hypothetical protein